MWRAVSVALAFAAALSIAVPAVAAADGVRVWDTGGVRRQLCPPIDASNPREPRGGCATDMFSGGMDIVVRSIVGDMIAGTCAYEHDMLVDGRGRTYLTAIAPGGPSPCNDMNACFHEDVRPWRGQIEAGPHGRLTHVVQACFDTCMGQFAGELRLGLERVGGHWRQTADHAIVGDSGYQISGDWRIGERDLDFRPQRSIGGDTIGWGLTSEPFGWPIQLRERGFG